MTRDDIIRMMRDAGLCWKFEPDVPMVSVDAMQRFAALVAATEREKCAEIAEACDDVSLAMFIRQRVQ